MSNPEVFEVLGGSRIGEKAEMLREHAPLIEESGLLVPPTTVIAQEALATPGADLTLGALVARAVQNNGNVPIAAVRSSGEGDARGSGIYNSVFSANNAAAVAHVIKDVLASFETKEAQEFRRQVGLGDEFGIIIHPLIGQNLPAGLPIYAPALSGFGYSSTARERAGFISVVAGFGGGLSRRGGERIRPQNIEGTIENPMSFSEIVAFRMDAEHPDGRILPSSDFRPAKIPQEGLRSIVGEGFKLSEEQPQPVGYDIWTSGSDNPLAVAMDLFEPDRFIETLQSMEQRAGYPLYVEWAITTDGKSLSPWIVQIAPIEEKGLLNIESAESLKEVHCVAHGVIGSGMKKAKKIVELFGLSDLKHLREFNADPENEGYILIYPSDLPKSMSDAEITRFGYLYNASVVLERPVDPAESHAYTPIAHFGGTIDLTGKFFGVVDTEKSKEPEELGFVPWVSPTSKEKVSSLRIVEGDFTITVDEMSDELIIGTT